MNVRRPRLVFFAIAGFALLAGTVLSYTSLAARLDNGVYDFLFQSTVHPHWQTRATLVTIDERTLAARGGMRSVRRMVADVLPVIARNGALATAVDITLADKGDEDEDAALDRAFSGTPNLVLAAEMMPDGSGWQEPIERFRKHAKAIGHVGALADAYDAIIRELPLERAANGRRHWALCVEAFRVATGADAILSSPTDVQIGQTVIASRWDQGRPMRIRYRVDGIPEISVDELLTQPERGRRLTGKVVFIGVTAFSAMRDRYFTPLSDSLPQAGVEIHAQAFDTIDGGRFLDNAPLLWPLLVGLAVALGVALLFTFTQGWWAYAGALAFLILANSVPKFTLANDLVMPFSGPAATAWIAVLGCASWQYFFVRRQLKASETDRVRYQQAIRFVTHEMRTPLTAIQGSSEIITRYNLPEEKRKQIGQMINSESKRLAQMITTFLNVEKLGAGQMELKKVSFPLSGLVKTCMDRVQPLAERKHIQIETPTLAAVEYRGDPELLEYAVYNLITNAIKYSPEHTTITLVIDHQGGEAHLAVRDQGYGMDDKEVKKLFTKFFRARSAGRSGEDGTGLGLSIAGQVITLHGGRIQVDSKPGEGSCFTVILPISETPDRAPALD
ncbi:MAG: CHASE2 domain-containing protein [Bryobacterales bacterium]|nr:CHASE2 domain-containing protein [Bryobacterales bacterium]